MDGEFSPEFSRATGGETIGSISLKQAGEIIELTGKRDGQIYFNGSLSVSADGKNFTYRAKITDRQGRTEEQVRVYDRQP